MVQIFDTQNIFFLSKAIACGLLAKIASLCSKYMPPAKSITLHLDFHIIPLNICHGMDE